jgi:hypothetical protein
MNDDFLVCNEVHVVNKQEGKKQKPGDRVPLFCGACE